MSVPVYFLTICLPLATLLVIFGMKYFAAIQQARASQTREAALEQLVQQASAAQQRTAAELERIKSSLASLDQSVAGIGRILAQVE